MVTHMQPVFAKLKIGVSFVHKGLGLVVGRETRVSPPKGTHVHNDSIGSSLENGQIRT